MSGLCQNRPIACDQEPKSGKSPRATASTLAWTWAAVGHQGAEAARSPSSPVREALVQTPQGTDLGTRDPHEISSPVGYDMAVPATMDVGLWSYRRVEDVGQHSSLRSVPAHHVRRAGANGGAGTERAKGVRLFQGGRGRHCRALGFFFFFFFFFFFPVHSSPPFKSTDGEGNRSGPGPRRGLGHRSVAPESILVTGAGAVNHPWGRKWRPGSRSRGILRGCCRGRVALAVPPPSRDLSQRSPPGTHHQQTYIRSGVEDEP